MKLRKFLISFLAFLLVFSNGIISISAVNLSVSPNKDLQKPTNSSESIQISDLEDIYKPDEDVRVIVELIDAPAVKYATDKGVKFAELSEVKQTQLQDQIFAKQESIKNEISKLNVNMKFEQKFATAFNGFSGFVKFGELEKIEKLKGVKKVWIATEYERPDIKPEMVNSTELVEALLTWEEYGYDGTGMVVGVIDSGVDPTHKDFVLSDEDAAALSKEDVEALIESEGLPGKYFTPKVPYGYNYMDENHIIIDTGPNPSEHGMHVAGIVGANGDIENGGIKGVAPEAQILALKVFGNDPTMGSTWSDIYIRAIDDAIILGADVVNMSLGAPAGFVNHEAAENVAIENAIDHGILFSISAGNNAHLGNGFFNPYVKNIDYGVVGTPGLSTNSLQVASIDNTMLALDGLKVYVDGEELGIYPFDSQGNVDPVVSETTFELFYAGYGFEEDYEGADLTGKYALVSRGEQPFVDKALFAQAAGAEGIIIFNNEDGMVNMATDPDIVIPQLFMFKSEGDKLVDFILNESTVSIEFTGDSAMAQNPTAEHMSPFTSWGVTPNLDLKPEITAPGGSILSTLQHDRYGIKGGTSMAAPHVAGGAALVLQKVDDKFQLTGKDRVRMAKNILMNTAEAVLDKGDLNQILDFGVPYSPRRQGAGLMKLHSAISTPVVVTEETTGEAKVALREVGDTFSFTLTATNFGEEEVTYDVDANIQSDLQIFGVIGNAYYTGELDQLEAAFMEADITINGGETSITIGAGETVTFDVEFDLSNARVFGFNDAGQSGFYSPEDLFPNGYFVEGFVTLTDESDSNPMLSVPYVGFKGDWNAAPVLDELDYDGNDSFYEQAGALYPAGEPGLYNYLGFDPFTGVKHSSSIAISPNTDSDQDRIIPILSFLRNAKSVEYYIVDEEGNELRKLRTDLNVRKNYYDRGLGLPYRLDSSLYWDGTVNGKVVDEGQYYFEIRSTIDYPGKDAQIFRIPVQVDVTAPELNVEYNDGIVSIDASDNENGSGIRYIEFLINGDSLGILPPTAKEVEIGNDLPSGTVLTVIAVDYAGNESSVVFSGINDNEGPLIYVDTPGTTTIHNTNDILVAGKVVDDSKVVEFKINNQDVELIWVEEEGHYIFEAEVFFENGEHPIRIYAKDEAGNESSLANSRTIYVDSMNPVIELGEFPAVVSKDMETVEVTANISDNFDSLRFYVNGSEVFYHPFTEVEPISEEVTLELALDLGENEFTFELVDAAGNRVTKEITIEREAVDRMSGETRYDTAVEISQAGWESAEAVVIARGDSHADALAGVPLAQKLDAPLLLTRTNALPEVTLDEIERLGAETVYVLGGDGAVSPEVRDELTEAGLEVIVVKGNTREETAVEIARELIGDGEVDTAIIVNRLNFPDALTVASYAAAEGLPIFLTHANTLTEATANALEEFGIENTIVIGGTSAVSEAVFEQLPNPERVSGTDRYATSIAVAEYFDVDTTEYYVATGRNFPDALAGAALAAKQNTGILLVKDIVTDELAEFITSKGLESITVLGGSTAVGERVYNELLDLLK